MNEKPSILQKKGQIFTLLARLVLGGFIIYTGVNKALDPVSFLKLIKQYEVIQNHVLLNSIAALLPWFEIFCGLLLLTGIAIRGTALILMVMLGAFTGLIVNHALNIMTMQAISFCAVKFDCGCGTGEVFVCHKIPENLGLILLSGWMLFAPSTKPFACSRS